MISLARRLRAATVLGVFLSGTLGLPLTDGVMFHLAGRDPCAGVIHVEAHGGLHHADRCTLAQPVAAQQESLGSAQAVRIAPLQITRQVPPAVTTPIDIESATHQHSRAPPA